MTERDKDDRGVSADPIVDGRELGEDDELGNLFSAFDDVHASPELQDATIARILGMAEAATASADIAESRSADQTDAADSANAPSQTPSPQVKAISGGKSTRSRRKAKWRAIRVAAIAACLTLALTGGIAYATPATYYDIEQDGAVVTLGVNCFGITVSATSDDEGGQELVKATDLCNMPYEESLARAIEQMEQRNPQAPVEFGPQGGEKQAVQPQQAQPQGPAASQASLASQPSQAPQQPQPQENPGAGAGAPASGPDGAQRPAQGNAPSGNQDTGQTADPAADQGSPQQDGASAMSPQGSEPANMQPQGEAWNRNLGDDAGQSPAAGNAPEGHADGTAIAEAPGDGTPGGSADTRDGSPTIPQAPAEPEAEQSAGGPQDGGDQPGGERSSQRS